MLMPEADRRPVLKPTAIAEQRRADALRRAQAELAHVSRDDVGRDGRLIAHEVDQPLGRHHQRDACLRFNGASPASTKRDGLQRSRAMAGGPAM